MIRSIAKFAALRRPERQVLLCAWLLLPLFATALRLLGLARLQAGLNQAPVVRATPAPDQVAMLAAMVGIASRRGPLPATCLTRCLLLGWMLRRRGVHSELRIGVRLIDGKLEAHAWLESDGTPINDAPGIGKEFAAFDQPLAFAALARR